MSDEQEPLLPQGTRPRKNKSVVDTLLHAPTGKEEPVFDGGSDDVSNIKAFQGEDHDEAEIRKESVFSKKIEEELKDNHPKTWSWFTRSLLGYLTQFGLLLGVIGVYTFTPLMVNYSKEVHTGLTGDYRALPVGDAHHWQPKHFKHLIRRDAEVDLGESNWPAGDLEYASETKYFDAQWTGDLVLAAGEYEFWLSSKDGNATVDINGETGNPAKISVGPSGATYPVRLHIHSLPLDYTTGQSVQFLYKGPKTGGKTVLVPRFEMRYDHTLLRTVPKGQPYLDAAPTAITETISFCSGVIVAYLIGTKEGEPMKYVNMIFNPTNILAFAPAAIGWAISDVFEVLANSGLDPTTYVVLSQSRLVATALAMKFMLGKSQMTIQWGILTSLSIVLIVYNIVDQTTSTSSAADSSLWWFGFAATVGKIGLSVLCGVYGEKYFKGFGHLPFFVQITNVTAVSVPTSYLVLPLVSWMRGTPLQTWGMFGGPDGGWTWATWMVVALYVARLWVTNLALKRFDALVKNLCNAGASVPTYFIGVYIMHSMEFDIRKVMLILAVVVEVCNLSLSKMYQPIKQA